MELNFELFPATLKMMGLGMGGIFIAMLVLYLISSLLIRILPEKEEGTDE